MVVEHGVGTQETRPFLERVASTDPVPGGGSAAAVMCAIGGALAEMVGNLTASKPKYEAMRPEMETLAGDARDLWSRALELAEADSAAYEGFIEAVRMPKETPEDAESRARAMSDAADHAATVPLEVCKAAVELLRLLSVARSKGLPATSTDVASGAAAAEAALKAASLNVLVNLSSIDDEERRLLLLGGCRELLEQGRRASESIDAEVRAEILAELEQ
jgi:formiminotetrahydrofolate cyclodeaminase